MPGYWRKAGFVQNGFPFKLEPERLVDEIHIVAYAKSRGYQEVVADHLRDMKDFGEKKK